MTADVVQHKYSNNKCYASNFFFFFFETGINSFIKEKYDKNQSTKHHWPEVGLPPTKPFHPLST